jgi:murein DD-endopeptidase MepM/ murein hydrolase activator NlpD
MVDGRLTISGRYATDWFLIKDGTHQKGDTRDRQSYYSYGQPVFAVGSGTIVTARDGIPDNVPGPVETFRPAVPKSLETITGNMIVLDLGRGQYASYFHLQPGSVRVKTGDYVQSGQPLARVGVSGDSNVPHLHFEVTTLPNTLAGEGVPYVIEQYRVKTARDIWQTVTHELPMRDVLVDFGPADGDAN